MALPTLFVIGDSISVGYGPHLAEYVKSVCKCERKPGDEEALKDLDIPSGANGGDSSMVLEYVRWLEGRSFHVESMQINCGLHDVRSSLETNEKQVRIEHYAENVAEIIAIAKRLAERVVWVRTTPVNEEKHNEGGRRGYYRFNADIDAYNSVADGIVQDAQVESADLHDCTANLPGDIFTDGVHFTDEVSKLQAAFLAGFHFARKQ